MDQHDPTRTPGGVPVAVTMPAGRSHFRSAAISLNLMKEINGCSPVWSCFMKAVFMGEILKVSR